MSIWRLAYTHMHTLKLGIIQLIHKKYLKYLSILSSFHPRMEVRFYNIKLKKIYLL